MRMLAWLVAVMTVPAITSAAPPDVEVAYEKGTVDLDGGSSLPYRMHRPAVAEGSKPIPLVVFLHGAGERGDDNSMQLRHFPDRWVRVKGISAIGTMRWCSPSSAPQSDGGPRCGGIRTRSGSVIRTVS